MVTIILGAQWGDEGKGKLTDLFAEKADYVLRFNGGNNAGHTIINSYGKFANQLVPAGIFHKKTISLITNGVVIDPEAFLKEMNTLVKAGIKLKGRLFISPRCHLIMPYHKVLDKVYEEAKGKGKTGTTGRGIGPVYADKVSYNGIRISDLLDDEMFAEKLEMQLSLKNKIIVALGGAEINYEEVVKQYQSFAKTIKPFVAETFSIVQEALTKKKDIMLEGAQAVFLDNDWGTYPFVTASSIVSGSVTSGAGIPPQKVDRVVGVSKAYATRVGSGPFPTELFDADGDLLREQGHEYGTNTGRPRRCGWFDAELIRFGAKLNGFTDLAITKLDVMDSFKKVKFCTGYTLNGKAVHYEDGNAEFLSKVKPVYKEMKGWNTPTTGIRSFDKLPKEAQEYVKAIEKLTGVKISYVSNGPKRDEIIKR